MVYFLGTYSFIILIFKQNIVFKVWVGAPAVQQNLVYARAGAGRGRPPGNH